MAIVDVGSGYKYAATENGINSAINAASPGDTVFVHSPSVYIEGYININKSIIFRGESWDSTAFLLGVHAGGEPTIYDSSADGTSDGAIKITANNVECCHFKVYAPQAIKSDDAVYGGGHGDQRNAFFVNQVSGIKIHNIKIPKYVYNDGIRFRYSHDCQVYDCEFPGGNHDTISFLHSYNISVKNVLRDFGSSWSSSKITGFSSKSSSFIGFLTLKHTECGPKVKLLSILAADCFQSNSLPPTLIFSISFNPS